jgi:hypothetical protein
MRQRHIASLAVLCIVLLTFVSGSALAQEHVPVPYSPEEFPAWMKDLWRAEVLFVGSFPFTFFFTLESFDTFRYVSSGLNKVYAPWPLQPGVDIGYSDQEKAGLIASAVVSSLIVAGIDFLLGRLNAPAAAR